MMRLGAKHGSNAVSHRRSLSLTTAIVALACAAAGMRPAYAQSVSGTGDLSPNTIQTPNWLVGADLLVGDTATGTLDITSGGTVTNDSGFVGYGASGQGTVTVSGHDINGNASTWINTGELKIGDNGTGSLTILDGGVVSSGLASIGINTDGTGAVTVSGRDVNGNASTWNAVAYNAAVEATEA